MTTKKSTDAPAKSATKTASKTASKSVAKTPAKSSAAPTKEAAPMAAAAKPAPPEKKAPTNEEISHLAHQYWKERGHHHGSHEDDWHRAEQELKSRS